MEKGCEQAERSGDARERSAADSGEDRLGHSNFKDRVRARLRPAESGHVARIRVGRPLMDLSLAFGWRPIDRKRFVLSASGLGPGFSAGGFGPVMRVDFVNDVGQPLSGIP